MIRKYSTDQVNFTEQVAYQQVFLKIGWRESSSQRHRGDLSQNIFLFLKKELHNAERQREDKNNDQHRQNSHVNGQRTISVY